jgi:hypothetical protein
MAKKSGTRLTINDPNRAGKVKFSINGDITELPVGTETTVDNDDVFFALEDSGIKFQLAEGQSAPERQAGAADAPGGRTAAPTETTPDNEGMNAAGSRTSVTEANSADQGDGTSSAGDTAGDDGEPNLLDNSIDDIVAGLDGLSREEIEQLKTNETAGKSRKGLLTELDRRLADEELK